MAKRTTLRALEQRFHKTMYYSLQSLRGRHVGPFVRRLRNWEQLDRREFELLTVFARNPNRALTRDELMDFIHRREATPFDRAIDVQVGRLRRKIERDPARPELMIDECESVVLLTPGIDSRRLRRSA